jgi:hypothetical protein
MAKEQDKPLNPEKISGLCGRLLCCLSYEEEGYKEMRRTLPKLGHRVSTPTGEGRVVAVNVLKRGISILVEGQRLEVPDRDLGTVVRWDPTSKSNEPPPSISRAEGVLQGMVEEDELDSVEAANEWPPRSARFGRLPMAAAPPPTGEARERPASRRPTGDPAAPAQRGRRRGGGAQRPRREASEPGEPSGGESPPSAPPPAGRSRVFRRADNPAPASEQPDQPTANEGQGEAQGRRRRGRRAGRGRNRDGGVGSS